MKGLDNAEMNSLEAHYLGETKEALAVETSEEHRLATLRMTRQSRRSIDIISHYLDPFVYDTPDVIEALKQLVLQHAQNRIRVLVFEPLSIVQRGHRMIELMHSLPTYIAFRKPGYEYDGFTESVFIADVTGYILRTTADRYEGTVNFNDPRGARTLRHKFDEMWERSRPDPNLKRIGL